MATHQSERILEGLLVALESAFGNEGAQFDHPLTLSAETMELLARKLREYGGGAEGDRLLEEALRLAQACRAAEGHVEWDEEEVEEDKKHVARTLQGLKQYFKVITSLKVVERDRHLSHVCDLSPFPSIQTLDIEGCPPSFLPTLFAFRGQLKFLRIQRAALMSLEELLGPGKLLVETYRQSTTSGRGGEEAASSLAGVELGGWRKLEHLSINHCDLPGLGQESMARLPHLFYLEVQHNALLALGPLDPLYSLRYIDASFNNIRSLVQTQHWSSHLTVLVLHKNDLKSLRGIEALTSLRHLNVSQNRIKRWAEVQRLPHLPRLEVLSLSGNPIALEALYRIHVYQIFNLPSRGNLALVLDGDHATDKEKQEVQRRGAFILLPSESSSSSTSSTLGSSLDGRRSSWSEAALATGVTPTGTPTTTHTGHHHHQHRSSLGLSMHGFGEAPKRDASALTLFPPAVEVVMAEEEGEVTPENEKRDARDGASSPGRWSFGYTSPWPFGQTSGDWAKASPTPKDPITEQLPPPPPSHHQELEPPSSLEGDGARSEPKDALAEPPQATTPPPQHEEQELQLDPQADIVKGGKPPPVITQQPPPSAGEGGDQGREKASPSMFQLWNSFMRTSGRSTPVAESEVKKFVEPPIFPSPLTLKLSPQGLSLHLEDTPTVSTPVDEEVEELAPLPHPFTPPSSIASRHRHARASPTGSTEGSVATSRELASEEGEEEMGGGRSGSRGAAAKGRRRRRRAEIEEENTGDPGGEWASTSSSFSMAAYRERARSASPYLGGGRMGKLRRSPGVGKRSRGASSTSPQVAAGTSSEEDRLRVISPAPPSSQTILEAAPVMAVKAVGEDAGQALTAGESESSSAPESGVATTAPDLNGASDVSIDAVPSRASAGDTDTSGPSGVASATPPPTVVEAEQSDEEEEEEREEANPELQHLEGLINKMKFEVTRMESVGLQKFIAPMQASIAQLEGKLQAAKASPSATRKVRRRKRKEKETTAPPCLPAPSSPRKAVSSPAPPPPQPATELQPSATTSSSVDDPSALRPSTMDISIDVSTLAAPPPPASPLPDLQVAPKNFKGDRFSRRSKAGTPVRMARLGSPEGVARSSPQIADVQKCTPTPATIVTITPTLNEEAKESISVPTATSPHPMPLASAPDREGRQDADSSLLATIGQPMDEAVVTPDTASSPPPPSVPAVTEATNPPDSTSSGVTANAQPLPPPISIKAPVSPTMVIPHMEEEQYTEEDLEAGGGKSRPKRGQSLPVPATHPMTGSPSSAFTRHKASTRRGSWSSSSPRPTVDRKDVVMPASTSATIPPSASNSTDHDDRRSSISSSSSIGTSPLMEPVAAGPYIGAARYAFTEVTLDMDVLRTYFSEQVFGNGGYLGAFQVTSRSRFDSLDFNQVENLLYLYRIPLLADWREAVESGQPAPGAHYHDLLDRETVALVAVTNLYIYFLDDTFARQGKLFRDAPRPLILGRHHLRSLWRLVIGFMGQTLRLEFQPMDTPTTTKRPMPSLATAQNQRPSWMGLEGPTAATLASTMRLDQGQGQGGWCVHGYTLITRDKKLTYDLLQDVRRLANEKRVSSTSQRPLDKTQIANMEEERLELMDAEDLLYYQLMYQWWRQQPGLLQPRTVFVTGDDRLHICIEDFRQGGPRAVDPSHKPKKANKFSAMPTEGERITSVLSASLRDVVSVEEENDPRYITITVKDQGLFSWNQTWRLFSENRKHIDGLRRVLRSRVDDAVVWGEAVQLRPSISGEHHVL